MNELVPFVSWFSLADAWRWAVAFARHGRGLLYHLSSLRRVHGCAACARASLLLVPLMLLGYGVVLVAASLMD